MLISKLFKNSRWRNWTAIISVGLIMTGRVSSVIDTSQITFPVQNTLDAICFSKHHYICLLELFSTLYLIRSIFFLNFHNSHLLLTVWFIFILCLRLFFQIFVFIFLSFLSHWKLYYIEVARLKIFSYTRFSPKHTFYTDQH